MVTSSPLVQSALRMMVPAGTTAGQAVREGGAPTTGPDAIVVRDAQGSLRDFAWAPDSDTEAEDLADRVGVEDAVSAISGWVARRDNRSPSAAELPIGE